MTDTLRKSLLMVFGVLILGVTHYAIYDREALLEKGETVLLQLAPVDPRSLMQGDYMTLRFAIEDSMREAMSVDQAGDGEVVLAIGEDRVAEFLRLDSGGEPAQNEVRMHYRVRNREIKFATNAFFFEEGQGHRYTQARYGEFRVGKDGDALLVALRDEHRERLGDPSSPRR